MVIVCLEQYLDNILKQITNKGHPLEYQQEIIVLAILVLDVPKEIVPPCP